MDSLKKFIKYKIVKNSRKKILVNKINSIIKYKKKIKITDYGSGYDNYVAKLLGKKLKKRGINCKFFCYDDFDKNYITNNSSLNFKLYKYNNNYNIQKCDYLMVNDVLHHIEGINEVKLKKIFKRFFNKTKYIILKDHFQYGIFSNFLLQFMDYVGNSYYGLKTPKKYFNKKEFDLFLEKNEFIVEKKLLNVRYYSKFFLFLSNPKLHFIYLIKESHK